MKHVTCILAALALCIGMAGPCLAAAEDADAPIDSEIREITWEEILNGTAEDDYDGEFVRFKEIGIEMFVFHDFQPMEIDEEMADMYFLGYFTTDEEAMEPAVTLQYVDSMGLEEFDDYRLIIESMEGDVTEIMGEVIINGLHCLMYQIPENDVLVIGTVIEDGVMEITFLPFSDQELVGAFELMAGSIREIAESDDSGELLIDDGSDTVTGDETTENDLADLLQELLDSLKQEQD